MEVRYDWLVSFVGNYHERVTRRVHESAQRNYVMHLCARALTKRRRVHFEISLRGLEDLAFTEPTPHIFWDVAPILLYDMEKYFAEDQYLYSRDVRERYDIMKRKIEENKK